MAIPWPDFSLRRYLVAREWDVHAAEKQLKGTLEWRKETKPQHVECGVCIKTPGSHAMVNAHFLFFVLFCFSEL